MRQPPALVLAGAVMSLLLAGCGEPGTAGGSSGAGPVTVDVDVDTPELRAAKNRAGIEPCEPGEGGAVEGGLPEVTLRCLGGGQDVDLAGLRGPLVVNLWAQWCGPCREELPYYQQLHERADGKVDVVGIDYQDTLPAKALELADQTGVTYPLLADPEAQVRVPFRVRGLPGVVLVDADGTVVHVEYVVIRSYDQLRELVEEHLGVRV
ncbi:MAG TPA: TlpA disulfide reductase family protein [Nocardioidaceae bacterium]|nr:TlpA disulfide reductase family protein [Nocardioidaceae bacterium]HSE72075.1 TlpA disulfide reductase family protein [Nocardioidaceae bacterium]